MTTEQVTIDLDLDIFAIAMQGNAILGIRNSGKTYTATWMAERMLDNRIPFIAFDPIGVWRFLRVGLPGNAGYPIVVAGDGGDLPLTPETAPNIVRAAMLENIPLVIDLYSTHLSKADWRRIVAESVRLLLYENKPHGLRHIFIEEAAEFIPQRIRPEEGVVYAEFEKLTRLGRNASLGYTLINARAEEVNKAILEICDCLFLHRQKGKNSLLSLSKWLDVADASNRREIIKSLPTLEQGTCWIWPEGVSDPSLVRVPPKNTVHPNPAKPEIPRHSKAANVDEFIAKMQESLRKQSAEMEQDEAAAEPARTIAPHKDGRIMQIEELQARHEDAIHRWQATLHQRDDRIRELEARNADLMRRIEGVRDMLRPDYERLATLFGEMGEPASLPDASMSDASKYDIWLQRLHDTPRAMLEILIQRRRLTQQQLALLVGLKLGTGWWSKHIKTLKDIGLITTDGEYLILNDIP